MCRVGRKTRHQILATRLYLHCRKRIQLQWAAISLHYVGCRNCVRTTIWAPFN